MTASSCPSPDISMNRMRSFSTSACPAAFASFFRVTYGPTCTPGGGGMLGSYVRLGSVVTTLNQSSVRISSPLPVRVGLTTGGGATGVGVLRAILVGAAVGLTAGTRVGSAVGAPVTSGAAVGMPTNGVLCGGIVAGGAKSQATNQNMTRTRKIVFKCISTRRILLFYRLIYLRSNRHGLRTLARTATAETDR